ncbi:MAG: type II secretion system protein [Gemmatimonadetes bacterium]|nr:type II secretion system protein [Gemmatimonadota bacterium]
MSRTSRSLGRHGGSLIELLLAMVVLGLAALVALPPFRSAQDRLAAEGAAAQAVRSLMDGRDHAVRRSERTALRMDTASARLSIVAGPETVAVHDLGAVFGVTLSTTRDSIAWSPLGLGYGAANARLIVARGQAAETITVSRLGRVRR